MVTSKMIGGIIVVIVAVLVIAVAIGTQNKTTTLSTTTYQQSAYSHTTTPTSSVKYTTTITTSTTNNTTTNNSTTVAPQETVKIANSAALGSYLTNGAGYTLYTYSADSPNSGTSSCTGYCASLWPPFYVSNLVLPQGLNASAFGTITGAGGVKQLTYKGLPLYLYSGDSKPGQTNGQGVAGFYVAKV